MMLSMFLAPNTPDWLLTTVIVLFLGLIFGILAWATILEIRYIGPYTLIKASSKEKWRRATILALLQTATIPILGLVVPILSPLPDQWPTIPLYSSGVWIIVLPLTIVYKRWDFERHIKFDRRLDKMIKNKNLYYYRTFGTALTIMPKLLMTAELRRFFVEGYSEDIDNGDESGAKM